MDTGFPAMRSFLAKPCGGPCPKEKENCTRQAKASNAHIHPEGGRAIRLILHAGANNFEGHICYDLMQKRRAAAKQPAHINGVTQAQPSAPTTPACPVNNAQS